MKVKKKKEKLSCSRWKPENRSWYFLPPSTEQRKRRAKLCFIVVVVRDTMALPYPSLSLAAMPIDSEAHCALDDLDERTYRFLEDVWSDAVRRAEEALDEHAGSAHAPQDYSSNPAAPSSPSSSSVQGPARQSPAPRNAEGVVVGAAAASSPLPRAPPLLHQPKRAPPAPTSLPSHQQQQQQPILRRPAVNSRTSWMKVEAQPNLTRNGYTSRKGVAWVVQ